MSADDRPPRRPMVGALDAAEGTFAKAFTLAPLYLAISSLETGKFLAVNDAFVELSGYSRAEAVGKSHSELRLWADTRERDEGLAELRRDGRVDKKEVRLRLKSGEVRTFLLSAEVVDLGGERCILNAAADITERKTAEAALGRSEERLRQAVELARLGTWSHDAATNITRFDERAREIFGLEAAAFPPEHVAARIHPGDVETFDATRKTALAPGGPGTFAETHRIVRPDGAVRWVRGQARIFFEGEGAGRVPVRGVGTVQDVTELKRAEAALKEANETLEARVQARTRQVRELAGQLTLAEARERSRLARVLHDGLQQQLYGVQFSLREVRNAVGESAEALAAVEATEALLQEAFAIARTTTANLSPPVLQDEGLVEALAWLGNDMHKRHGLTVTVDAPGALSVPGESVRVLLFSLIRELLFNAVKHADVGAATVELDEDERELSVTVSDQGKGFDPETLDERRSGTGLGLSGVRRRLQLFGGELMVASTKGGGTRVTIVMPRASLSLD